MLMDKYNSDTQLNKNEPYDLVIVGFDVDVDKFVGV